MPHGLFVTVTHTGSIRSSILLADIYPRFFYVQAFDEIGFSASQGFLGEEEPLEASPGFESCLLGLD